MAQHRDTMTPMKMALVSLGLVAAVFLYPWIRALLGRDEDDVDS